MPDESISLLVDNIPDIQTKHGDDYDPPGGYAAQKKTTQAVDPILLHLTPEPSASL